MSHFETSHVAPPPKKPLEESSMLLFQKYGIGFQLLGSMGWSAGEGLGKLQDGLVAPVAATQVTQVGSRGLGFTSRIAAITQSEKQPRRVVVPADYPAFCELCFALLTKDNSGPIERELGSQNRTTGQITGDALCTLCTEVEEAEENKELEKKFVRIRNSSARRLYIELTGWVGELHEASWRPETNTEIYEAVLAAVKTEEEQRDAEQARQALEYERKKEHGLIVEEDIFDFSNEPTPNNAVNFAAAPKQKPLVLKKEEVRGGQGQSKKSWQKPKIFVAGLGWVEEDKLDADGKVRPEELAKLLEEINKEANNNKDNNNNNTNNNGSNGAKRDSNALTRKENTVAAGGGSLGRKDNNNNNNKNNNNNSNSNGLVRKEGSAGNGGIVGAAARRKEEGPAVPLLPKRDTLLLGQTGASQPGKKLLSPTERLLAAKRNREAIDLT